MREKKVESERHNRVAVYGSEGGGREVGSDREIGRVREREGEMEENNAGRDWGKKRVRASMSEKEAEERHQERERLKTVAECAREVEREREEGKRGRECKRGRKSA